MKHGGVVYGVGISPLRVVDFSASINPLGPPLSVMRFLGECGFEVRNYPDMGGRGLCGRIRDFYSLPAGNGVVLGNGSIELIHILPQALGVGAVLTFNPTFSEYTAVCARYGIKEERHELRPPFKPGVETICEGIERVREKTPVLVYLCNPNNPTGSLLGQEEICRVLENIGNNYLAVDEAFIDFCPEHSVIKNEHPRLIVLRSFTKFYSIPGLRLGFLSAVKEIAERVEEYKIPWSVNALAMRAGELCLSETDFGLKSIDYIKREREIMYNRISGISGLYPYPSNGNFLLVRTNGKERVKALADYLKERLILIRDCASFGLPDHFRIAVKLAGDNEKLICALLGEGGNFL